MRERGRGFPLLRQSCSDQMPTCGDTLKQDSGYWTSPLCPPTPTSLRLAFLTPTDALVIDILLSDVLSCIEFCFFFFKRK